MNKRFDLFSAINANKQFCSEVVVCGIKWTASSEFHIYRLCEQRRFRRACASAQSHQNLRCSLIQAVSQEEPSDRKPDPWPLWMAGHAQLKFVMTECSKTQIRLTGLKYFGNKRLIFGILTNILRLWKKMTWSVTYVDQFTCTVCSIVYDFKLCILSKTSGETDDIQR